MEKCICDTCLYNKNCQRLILKHKNTTIGCTSYKNEADFVERSAYEQVKWERDVAMEQLKEAGIPFGGKADVVAVRHGKWKLHDNGDGTCDQCHFRQMHIWDYDNWQNYCGVCGAKMDGEK